MFAFDVRFAAMSGIPIVMWCCLVWLTRSRLWVNVFEDNAAANARSNLRLGSVLLGAMFVAFWHVALTGGGR